MTKLVVDLYDFDKTIYAGDSSIDFYLFAVKSDTRLLRFLPKQLFHFVLYALRLEPKKIFKGNFFAFIKGIDDFDGMVASFWKVHRKKIYDWFPVNERPFVIVSASPSLILDHIANELGAYKLIATNIDAKTGKLIGENCYGAEKVRMINTALKDAIFRQAYSDSISDAPMLGLAEDGFLVKNNKFKKF